MQRVRTAIYEERHLRCIISTRNEMKTEKKKRKKKEFLLFFLLFFFIYERDLSLYAVYRSASCSSPCTSRLLKQRWGTSWAEDRVSGERIEQAIYPQAWEEKDNTLTKDSTSLPRILLLAFQMKKTKKHRLEWESTDEEEALEAPTPVHTRRYIHRHIYGGSTRETKKITMAS